MLKELVEKLLSYGEDKEKALEKQKAPQSVPFLSDHTQVTYLVNGEIESDPIAIPPRKHIVNTVDDLIAAVKRWDTKPVVWVASDKVTVVIDDDTRRDTITTPLVYSQLFNTVRSLKNPLDQMDMVRLLRTTFRHAVSGKQTLAAIRQLKFRKLSEGSVDIQHGKESLGRAINNEVSGADAIPESIVLPLNIYANHGEQHILFPIEFDLEIDAEAGEFHLKPMPDAIDDAVRLALESIQQRIQEGVGEDIPVLYGSVG